MTEETKDVQINTKVEVKTEKKKFSLSDTWIIILLLLFAIFNFIAMGFLFPLEESMRNASLPFEFTIEQLEDQVESLQVSLLDQKRNYICEEKDEYEEELILPEVGVEIEFYDEYREPTKVSKICTDCTVREAGVVANTEPYTEELIGLKYFILRKFIENDDYSYYRTSRILANQDYSKIYALDDYDSFYLESQNLENVVTKYSLSLLSNLLPDAIGDTNDYTKVKYFQSDKGIYFKSAYLPDWGGENEIGERGIEQFDTYKDVIIYVSKDNPDLYYVVTKEHFLALLEYMPSLSIRPDSDPYPITWEGDIRNTADYSYGYDACGAMELRKTDLKKEDLKITGYKIGTQQPVYEHLDSQHADLKKMYEDDYLAYIYPYEYNPNNAPALTYAEFLNQHPIIFWEDELGRLIMFYNLNYVMEGGCAKPIIYLYPERETAITVKVVPTTGALTFTYPQYNDKWEVISDKNSCIKDREGNTYEYLWWESNSKYLPEIRDGFVVKYDSLGVFLDLILTNAGFNYNEIKDFKEFWIPTMTAQYSPYFKIHFLQNEDVDIVANLLIHPQPTTEIRLFMIYERLDSYENIPVQEIVNTQRNGFTVTEWGGTRR